MPSRAGVLAACRDPCRRTTFSASGDRRRAHPSKRHDEPCVPGTGCVLGPPSRARRYRQRRSPQIFHETYVDADDDPHLWPTTAACAASPSDCWAPCEDTYGDNLVAIDWVDEGTPLLQRGKLLRQRDCECRTPWMRRRRMTKWAASALSHHARLGGRTGAAAPGSCGSSRRAGRRQATMTGASDEDWSRPGRTAAAPRAAIATLPTAAGPCLRTTRSPRPGRRCASMDLGRAGDLRERRYNPTPPCPRCDRGSVAGRERCEYVERAAACRRRPTCCPDSRHRLDTTAPREGAASEPSPRARRPHGRRVRPPPRRPATTKPRTATPRRRTPRRRDESPWRSSWTASSVAALAAIAFGAYWFMRAKGRAAAGAEPPMVEVQRWHRPRSRARISSTPPPSQSLRRRRPCRRRRQSRLRSAPPCCRGWRPGGRRLLRRRLLRRRPGARSCSAPSQLHAVRRAAPNIPVQGACRLEDDRRRMLPCRSAGVCGHARGPCAAGRFDPIVVTRRRRNDSSGAAARRRSRTISPRTPVPEAVAHVVMAGRP